MPTVLDEYNLWGKLMKDISDKLPVPHCGSELIEPNSARHPVLRRMTEGLLEQARQMVIQRARHRLGAYELRDPDYQLICLWADNLSMAPQALLDILAQSRIHSEYIAPIAFAVQDGAIATVTNSPS